MTVLSGAAMTLRTLADGTVRVTVDFEPKDRKACMEMMGEPGQPIAVTALKAGHAAASPGPSPSFRDLGAICREAIDLCKNPAFHGYVEAVTRKPLHSVGEVEAKAFIVNQCSVTSRKELDTAEGARDLFIGHIRTPFQAWLRKAGG
jgi:hypothetical protein